jgi:hypothetical protein
LLEQHGVETEAILFIRLLWRRVQGSAKPQPVAFSYAKAFAQPESQAESNAQPNAFSEPDSTAKSLA